MLVLAPVRDIGFGFDVVLELFGNFAAEVTANNCLHFDYFSLLALGEVQEILEILGLTFYCLINYVLLVKVLGVDVFVLVVATHLLVTHF